MTMNCDEVRMSLGVHALGALDPEEHAAVEAHLAGCEECRAEAEELAGVAGFLGRVSQEDVVQVASPPRAVLDRLLDARTRRRRRTARTLLAVAASVVLAGVGGTVWMAAERSAPEMSAASAPDSGASAPSAAPGASQYGAFGEGASEDAASAPRDGDVSRKERGPSPDAAVRAAPSESAAQAAPSESAGPQIMLDAPQEPLVREEKKGAVRARVTAVPGAGATAVEVVVSGVAEGTRFRLDAVDAAGNRETAGSWTVDRAAYEESGPFRGSVTIPPGGVDRFELATVGGRVLLVVPAR
ncbi:zf-HC2 domain-containing protein [Planomonospora sp. ID91781]|uniref:Anti-sigma factor n=1 Tax=Planomonospora sphaerica TaxID=161355 RepID=A0A171C848_9ACTN|nr:MULTISPECIES: zf-HC2 domain-containing protein [Planomonospora]MBG0820513.1 zf-HC2 domain-containing protein [Planomonospora sp. ID91781]GAT66262.1 anti-sigma factor [Planomonospora sphaerica]